MSSFPRSTLRIATRASQLALWQSNYVAGLVRDVNPDLTVELINVSTTGDRDQTEALRTLGSFGVFTREVQLAILDGRADLAVHSLKDLPTDGPRELFLAATPPRAPVHDALIFPTTNGSAKTLLDLPQGARVGTGSPRRQAQLRYLRPDLKLTEVRGNVDTRLRKLDAGEYDALILAAAGLTRLGLAHRIQSRITPPQMYPAVGQGAIGVECRSDDSDLRMLLAKISDPATMTAVIAERSLLSTLRAGCHAPLGVESFFDGGQLRLESVVLTPDGEERWVASATAALSEAVALGETVANLLIAQGAGRALNR